MTQSIEQYYFKTRGQEPDTYSTERCKVKNNGIMIGSVACQECEHCKGTNQNEYGSISWIKCELIESAK